MDVKARPLAERLEGRRVGVVLSAGYFGFYGHAGFLLALEDAGVEVACWSGSSAGALVAAMAASGMTPTAVLERLAAVRRDDFWDPDPLGALVGGLKGHGATGLLKGELFRRRLARDLPGRLEDLAAPCLVLATNLTRNAPQAFTRGEIAPRVHASCAYPGLFRAAVVDGELFWDGGLVDKAPALALHRAFEPEAILVHYLPSRAGGSPAAGLAAYPKALAAGMAALRQDHFRLQVDLLRSQGVEVHLITTELEELGPSRLDRGPGVAREAQRKVAETLTSWVSAPM